MKIAVTSPSFSKHPELIKAMEEHFPDQYKLNSAGTRFSGDTLIEYLDGYDAAIIGLEEMNAEILGRLPELKIISKYGVGLNNIDLEYCRDHRIQIGWTGGVNKTSVAEMVIGYALTLLRNIYVSSNLMKNGSWVKDGGKQLTGRTVGIIGAGNIGKELIRLLAPFHCRILVNDIVDQKEYYSSVGAEEVTLEELLRLSEVVSVHVPLNDETAFLLNEQKLELMRDDAILINTARGGIVDEAALYRQMKECRLAGAAMDVFEEEPCLNSPLLTLPNFIGTPHICGNAKEAVYAMGMSAIKHLEVFRNGSQTS